MTAAALKHPEPELFRNLFASRPDRSGESSLAATTISLLFHVSLIAGAVWASAQLRHVVLPSKDAPIDMTFVPVTAAKAPAPAAPVSSAPPTHTAVPSGPSIAMPTPGPIVDYIPRGSDLPFAEPQAPVAGSGGSGSSVQPGAGGGDEAGAFQPSAAIMPALLNVAEVRRALERNYPPLLRDAGIGGRTTLWLYIDEAGQVVRAVVKEGSGQSALDDVALRLAPLMKFSPARNGGVAVRVIAAVPVAFTAR